MDKKRKVAKIKTLCFKWLAMMLATINFSAFQVEVKAEELATAFQPADGEGTEASPYLIMNAGNLAWFRNQVNSGNPGLNAVLTNDIDLSSVCSEELGGWETICPSKREPFAGTFDGNGYEIKNFYAANGLFAFSSGNIKNLGLSGTVDNRNRETAGICEENNGTISNCYNLAAITGYDNTGGICYLNNGIITNCYNGGTIYCAHYHGGGICGFNNGILSNCYNTGSLSGYSIYNYGIAGTNYGSVINCYYLEGTGTEPDKNATVMTAEEFKNGKVAWLLNRSVTDGTQAWYQKLAEDGDAYPVLNKTENNTVYGKYVRCDGLVTGGFTNNSSESDDHFGEHSFDEKGICSICGTSEQPEIVDGVYQISLPAHLVWFRNYVNDGNFSVDAVLTADIDLSTMCNEDLGNWIPFSQYNGTFDGAGFVIQNIYIKSDASGVNYLGLFAKNSGTIKNLGITGVVQTNSYCSGGICGENKGTIVNCYNAAEISGYSSAGGICGEVGSGKITQCYNLGTVSGYYNVGGICGRVNNGKITQCYNYSEATATNGSFGGIAGHILDGEVSKCYSVNSICCEKDSTKPTDCEVETADQFASGEVAFKLNGSTSTGDLVWYQAVGTDAAPTLKANADNVVYQYINCGGVVSYLNDSEKSGDDTDNHQFSEYGVDEETGKHYQICEVCDAHSEEGNHNFTVEDVTIDGANVSGATCTEKAKYYKSCADCGAVSTSDEDVFTDGKPLGHAWGEYSLDGDQTCTMDGHKTAACTRSGCGVTNTIAAVGAALGHDFSNPDNLSVEDADHLHDLLCTRDCGAAKEATKVIKDCQGEGNHLVLTVNGDLLEVEELNLTDGAAFYSPVDFVAQKVSYSRVANKDTMSLILPFDVPAAYLNGVAHKLSSFDGRDLHFETVDDIVANTPYMLSDIKGKGNPMVAEMANVEVKTSSPIDVEDATGKSVHFGVYEKSFFECGEYDYYGFKNNQFVKAGIDIEVAPFRAAVRLKNSGLRSLSFNPATLGIIFDGEDNEVTGVTDAEQTLTGIVNVYDVTGRALRLNVEAEDCTEGLAPGVYVVNGMKVIKR